MLTGLREVCLVVGKSKSGGFNGVQLRHNQEGWRLPEVTLQWKLKLSQSQQEGNAASLVAIRVTLAKFGSCPNLVAAEILEREVLLLACGDVDIRPCAEDLEKRGRETQCVRERVWHWAINARCLYSWERMREKCVPTFVLLF